MFDKKHLIIPLIVALIFVQSSHTIRIGLKADLFNGICNTTTIKTPNDIPVSVFYPISNHFLKYWNDDKELNKEVYAFWMSCKSHGTNQSDVISTKDRVIVDKNELVCIEFVTGKEEECKVRDENNKCLRGINAWSQPTGHCDFEK